MESMMRFGNKLLLGMSLLFIIFGIYEWIDTHKLRILIDGIFLLILATVAYLLRREDEKENAKWSNN